METPEWKFKPWEEDDTRENPTQSQFFTTTEVRSISNGFIREGIQNALDERFDLDKPVLIRITLSEERNAISPKEYEPYINKLKDHIMGCKEHMRNLPDFEQDNMNYLVFEDFNTNGLRGNPNESKDEDINLPGPHNFYYFWRNVGITGKAQDKLGRWGIGKTTFPASSRINTFWGYTIQSDTKSKLLLGQSILIKHNLASYPVDWGYKPYGYFGNFDAKSFFAKPSSSNHFIDGFKSIFNITRNEEPGLSLIIPFYNESITIKSLTLSVLEQYFFPILNNSLIIEIINPEGSTIINGDNISDLIRSSSFTIDENTSKFSKENLISLVDFTRWLINLPENEYFNLREPNPNNLPIWADNLWEGIDIQELVRKFDNDGRIAFNVPLKYHRNADNETPKICRFKVYLEKDNNIKKSEDHFIRENITIIDIKSLEGLNTRGIVLIEDTDLANLLGDSENPAHTQWQKDSQNFINKYIHGDKCISFITKSLQKIYSKLQKPAEGIDRELLKDIFFIEKEEEEDISPTSPDDDSEKDEKPKIEIIKIDSNNRPKVKLKKIQGGIILQGIPNPESKLSKVILDLAYLTTRGNPFKKYQIFDFELNKNPIRINMIGANKINYEKNHAEFQILDDSFEITIMGFDEKRDLYIKLKTEGDSDD